MSKPAKKISRRDAIKVLGAAAGASVLANLPTKWSKPELATGVLPAHAQTSGDVLPTVVTTSIVPGAGGPPRATFTGDVTADGGCAVTARGFVYSTLGNSNPTLADAVATVGSGLGSFSVSLSPLNPANTDLFGRAYATNCIGTAYGDVITFQTELCLVEGSLITLADGSRKPIERITYRDSLLVWNFDEARFDFARPLWIKKAQTASQFNLLEFSDGSTLGTISQHRIFNKQLGAFTYPMTEDTPLGTTTFNVHGREVDLVARSVVRGIVNHYNLVTDRHINLFANGILTSCRYNNLYPITDMRFVKDGRIPVAPEAYAVAEKYYRGLRLAEQNIPVEETVAYIRRMESLRAEQAELIPALRRAELEVLAV